MQQFCSHLCMCGQCEGKLAIGSTLAWDPFSSTRFLQGPEKQPIALWPGQLDAHLLFSENSHGMSTKVLFLRHKGK